MPPSSQALERKQGKFHDESWPTQWSIGAQDRIFFWIYQAILIDDIILFLHILLIFQLKYSNTINLKRR